jgi:hypothetical protein
MERLLLYGMGGVEILFHLIEAEIQIPSVVGCNLKAHIVSMFVIVDT